MKKAQKFSKRRIKSIIKRRILNMELREVLTPNALEDAVQKEGDCREGGELLQLVMNAFTELLLRDHDKEIVEFLGIYFHDYGQFSFRPKGYRPFSQSRHS